MYIATYILSLLDLFFTLYEASIFGADIELNPFGKILITNVPFGIFYKAVIVGFCLYLLWKFRERKSALWSARILFGLYGLLNLYHLGIIGYYLIFVAQLDEWTELVHQLQTMKFFL